MTGSTARLVIVELIANREERRRCNTEHGVIDNSPLRRVTGFYWKRTALEWHRCGRMRFGVVHVHVEHFGGGVDLVVEFVGPGSDDLLQIVVPEFAVIERVVTEVKGILLVR